MKYKEICTIKDISIRNSYTTITLNSDKIAPNALPGQFVGVRTNETYDPLLRRPFSICDADKNSLKLLILQKGKGTKILSSLSVGSELNTIGPLGNPFPLKIERKPLFIAGGVGIAPFLFYSKKLSSNYRNPKMIFGARTSALLPDLTDFEKFTELSVYTDDGSYQNKGNVISALNEVNLSEYSIFACGPTPMFKALKDYFSSQINSREIKAYFSLETFMGCGFGACKACAVEVKTKDSDESKYKMCCTDGPLFNWDEIIL